MSRDPHLDPDARTLERWLASVGGRLGQFVDGLETAPASPTPRDERRRVTPIGPAPRAFDEALAELFERAIPPGYNTAGPGYLAYIPGGGLPLAGVGALIADITNRYTGLSVAAPELVEIECAVIAWLCRAAGLPEGAFGILTTGGSMANFTATVTARVDRLGEDFQNGVIYTSEDAHHSVAKAARIAGFPKRAMRTVPVDAHRRLEPDALRRAIAADRAAGLSPFMVVAAAGTTNTGAVDRLDAIADVCAEEGLWLHVDGAYGGAFILTERGRARLRGIERADSITLDPHKGFFLPYGTGALLVRDRRTLHAAHADDAPYLPVAAAGATDFASLGGELSRDFRGIRLWLPLQVAGADAFTRALDEKLDLAELAARRVAEIPGVEIVAAPQLSLFAFRLTRDGLDQAGRTRLNERFLEATNRRGRIYVSATRLDGELVLRICVLSFRTDAARIAMGLADLTAAAAEALAAPS